MEKFDVTRKIWFYLVILLVGFSPSITQKPVSNSEISNVVLQVLQNPFIYTASDFNMLAKFILLFFLSVPCF